MKIEQLNKPDNTFKPVSIIFILETQAELDAWGGLFNTPGFTSVMEKACGDADIDLAWLVLKNAGADLDSSVANFVFKTFQNIQIK